MWVEPHVLVSSCWRGNGMDTRCVLLATSCPSFFPCNAPLLSACLCAGQRGHTRLLHTADSFWHLMPVMKWEDKLMCHSCIDFSFAPRPRGPAQLLLASGWITQTPPVHEGVHTRSQVTSVPSILYIMNSLQCKFSFSITFAVYFYSMTVWIHALCL